MEKHGDSSHEEDESHSEGEVSAGETKGTYAATNPVLIDVVFQPPNYIISAEES